jgi:SAM-dependent methyltransferase
VTPAHRRERAPPRLPSVEGLLALDPSVRAALRARLREAGWTTELLVAAEAVAPNQLDVVRGPIVERWLEHRGGPGAALARLFGYDGALVRTEAVGALGGELVDALLRCGILDACGDTVASRFRLMPFGGIHVASDRPDAGAEAAMGPGATTWALAQLVPDGAGAVLDLGCGSGALALDAAARGARRAVGTDVNPRALAFGRFNAVLNGLEVEFREGDLLEAVPGERFDLVVAQPPYIPRPEGVPATTYLHGGGDGDGVVLRFAAAMAGALALRGRAVLAFESPSETRYLNEKLLEAVSRAHVDVVTLAARALSPAFQAAAYASLVDGTLGAEYRDAARRYLDLWTSLGREVRRFVVVLRQSVLPRRLAVQLDVPQLQRATAAQLDEYLAGLDLASGDDQALLAAKVVLARGTTLIEERRAGSVATQVARSIRFEPGALATGHELTEAGAALLALFDDSPSVSDVVQRFANLCEEPPAAVRRKVIDFAREGLGRAMLAAGSRSAR